VKALVIYSGGRVLVFLAVAALLYAVGLRGLLLAAAALLVSLPLAYVLLRRQRDALAAEADRRLAERRERKEELRRRLDDDA